MSVRAEAVEALLYGAPERIIPLSKSAGKAVGQDLENSRLESNEPRRENLIYQLGRYYRVAIFGSARLAQDSTEFQFVTDLTRALVKARDVDIVTGGGPGMMMAANLGAKLAIHEASQQGKKLKARTHGLLIDLPANEPPNGHIDLTTTHDEFSTRLQDFLDRTWSAYNAPGGIGTLLEQLMVVQSIQVSHLKGYILISHPFWKPIVDSWNNELYHKRVAKGRDPLIHQEDLDIIQFSDNIPDIVDTISAGYDNWRKTIRDRVRIIE